MKINRNIHVKSSYHDKPIVTDTFFIKNNILKPVVLFCHGYKGYKDWGAWNIAAKYFAKKGVFLVKFNFSHNGGTIGNPIDFPDLQAFGENNYLIELNDLEDVISWVKSNPEYTNELDSSNITLIGHSRGGGIVTLKASENKAVKRLITWSSVSDFGARFPTGNLLSQWKKDGVSYILNGRTNQKMPHYYQFFETFKKNESRLTIKKAAEKLRIPHLIIHGDNDEVVLPKEAANLHQWNPKSKLKIIAGMNHPLGCMQPWEKSVMPTHLKKAVKESLKFISTYSI